MADAFVAVNGQRAMSCDLIVPGLGVWIADVEFDTVVTLSGSVTLVIGTLTFTGTVDPLASGSFMLKSKYRILGGAGGWHSTIPARHYHNDFQIKRSYVGKIIAAQVGETLSGIGNDSVGNDWIVQAGPASRAFTRLCPSWYVGYDGVTYVGERAQTEVTATFDLLDYDPHRHVATLAIDTPDALPVGSVLRDRLDVPLVVRSLDLSVSAGKLRAEAWCKEAA